MSEHHFPFSAIIGQQRLKLALTLCAIDPKIGGVLLSGARGTAKSTIARALLDLTPKGESGGQFVSLPLGASEERITGSLNLEKVLADGNVDFAPGLLHRAHKGILYVDEVNLLADHLVDLLLDVAASGFNTVERDGISHRHAAEFVLVGTMNPEEGELRPQLLDRYGLCVQVRDDFSEQERVAIVRSRLAYDANPERFVHMFANQQASLVERCNAARQQLAAVNMNDKRLAEIAALCVNEGVEGVRADIVIHRAARAHAAYEGRDEVSSGDIEAVAEFALAHRRREQPEAPPQSQQNNPPPPQSSQTQQPEAGDWGEMPPVQIGTGERRTLEGESAGVVKKKLR